MTYYIVNKSYGHDPGSIKNPPVPVGKRLVNRPGRQGRLR